jgi:hypothetical protein
MCVFRTMGIQREANPNLTPKDATIIT